MILSGFPLSSLIFWATHIVRQPYKFVIWHAWSQSQSKFLLQISQRKIMAAYSEVPTEPEGTQHQEQENQLAQGPLWALLCFCGLMCCRGSLLQTEICTPKNIHNVNTLLVTPVKWKRSLCHLSGKRDVVFYTALLGIHSWSGVTEWRLLQCMLKQIVYISWLPFSLFPISRGVYYNC